MNSIYKIFKIFKLLTKVKVAITIIVFIIIVSIAGTVIQQNLEEAKYSLIYGKILGKVIIATGLDDVYHVWWFTLLLILLILSIVLCSYKRLVSNIKNLFFSDLNTKIEDFDYKITVKKPFKKSDDFLRFFRKKHFMIHSKKAKNRIIFKLQKNVLSVLGSHITHLSIIIILIGSTIGAIWGYRYNLKLVKGHPINIPKTDIQFRLDKFTVEFDKETGMPQLYRSDISIIDKQLNIVKKTIEVNKPLHFNGIQFSQSSYGMHGMEYAVISVSNTGLKKKIGEYKVKKGGGVTVAGSVRVKVDKYVPDFRIDQQKRVFSASEEPKNPALKITLMQEGNSESYWSFLNFPSMLIHKVKTKYFVKFLKLEPNYYSILYVVKDPGLETVLAGFVLLSLGVFFLFFFNYYGAIVIVEKKGNSQIILKIKGICRKNESYMRVKLESLVKEIKKNQIS